jgi:alkylation response protein AidB-like acyl-CoA dehydrogenase
VVSGKKDFVTNGPIADFIAVAGLVGDQTALFLVEPNAPGVAVGPRIRTLGYNGVAVSSLELNDVAVSRSRTLGPFKDTALLQFVRTVEDLVLCVASVGLTYRAGYTAKKHAGSHERAGKPVIAHQEVRFKLAEILTLLQTAQLLTYRAGWMYAQSDPETATMVHCAKVFTAETSERVSNLAMQIMAGQGYVWGNPVERSYRDSKYAALAGTTSELARMAIADDLLARYR